MQILQLNQTFQSYVNTSLVYDGNGVKENWHGLNLKLVLWAFGYCEVQNIYVYCDKNIADILLS